MHADQFRELIRATLDDLRVSRGERRALEHALRDDPPTPAQWGEFRAIAFGEAREALSHALRPADVLNWLEEAVRLLIPRDEAAAGECAADVCFSPGEECRDRIAGLFRTAARTVDACVFTITDNAITDAILAAHQRGVRVRIVTDDQKAGDLGSDVERLRAAGVEVRLDRSRHHMHHKFAIFDGRCLVTGSYNWTLSAALDNEEDIVILRDPQLIQRFQGKFDRLWETYG